MAVIKWEFYDPVLSETYTFVLNPADGGTPGYRKEIATESVTAADGFPVLMEGGQPVQEVTFSGPILSKEHFNTLLRWYQKRYRIRWQDDLGRVAWVYLVEFTPRRKRSAYNKYRHDYEMKMFVLEWVDEALV